MEGLKARQGFDRTLGTVEIGTLDVSVAVNPQQAMVCHEMLERALDAGINGTIRLAVIPKHQTA